MPKILTFLALSFIPLAAAACGGGDDTKSTDPEGLTPDELAAETLDIRCRNGVECHLHESEAECKETSLLLSDQYKASIEAGRIIYHPSKAQACLDALETVLGCSVIKIFGDASTAASDLCREAYEPTVADGQACYSSTECISQNCEIPDCDMTCCEGKCIPESTLNVGDSCATEACPAGAYCQTDDMGMPTTCAAQLNEGEPCTSLDACKVPSFCALDFVTGMGTCVVPAAHGAACDTNAIFGCDRLDDYCDATTKKCVTSKLIGEPCGADAFCVFTAECKDGTCVKKPAEGGACDPSSFAQCLGDLTCEADGTCKLVEETACK
jgi:hypothetical protein